MKQNEYVCDQIEFITINDSQIQCKQCGDVMNKPLITVHAYHHRAQLDIARNESEIKRKLAESITVFSIAKKRQHPLTADPSPRKAPKVSEVVFRVNKAKYLIQKLERIKRRSNYVTRLHYFRWLMKSQGVKNKT